MHYIKSVFHYLCEHPPPLFPKKKKKKSIARKIDNHTNMFVPPKQQTIIDCVSEHIKCATHEY